VQRRLGLSSELFPLLVFGEARVGNLPDHQQEDAFLAEDLLRLQLVGPMLLALSVVFFFMIHLPAD